MFYAEIQDGHQKWRENYSWQKVPYDSACTLLIENFVKITPSRTVSKINVFLHFTRKSKIPPKNVGKTMPDHCVYPLQIIKFVELALSRTGTEINVFAFYR